MHAGERPAAASLQLLRSQYDREVNSITQSAELGWVVIRLV